MLRFTRAGSGPPMILLHGLGSRRQLWEPLYPLLTPTHTVYALDLPGFGDPPVQHFDSAAATVPEFAAQVAAFLDAEGIDRPIVGGSSLGGGIALELGRRGLACAVVGFSPIGFTAGAWARTLLAAARGAASGLSPLLPRLLGTGAGRAAVCGLFYGHPAAVPSEVALADARALIAAPGFAAARRALGDWRLTSPRALNDIPVTIAWGTRDRILLPGQARLAASMLPRARHVPLPGAGHLPFRDAPERCAELLLSAFLGGA